MDAHMTIFACPPTVIKWAAPAPCEYPPFVRRGLRYTPYWKTWEVGDRRYSINNDSFLRCIKESRELEVHIEKADGEEASGKSPGELGYTRTEYSAEYWEWEPQ